MNIFTGRSKMENAAYLPRLILTMIFLLPMWYLLGSLLWVGSQIYDTHSFKYSEILRDGKGIFMQVVLNKWHPPLRRKK